MNITLLKQRRISRCNPVRKYCVNNVHFITESEEIFHRVLHVAYTVLCGLGLYLYMFEGIKIRFRDASIEILIILWDDEDNIKITFYYSSEVFTHLCALKKDMSGRYTFKFKWMKETQKILCSSNFSSTWLLSIFPFPKSSGTYKMCIILNTKMFFSILLSTNEVISSMCLSL